MSDLKRSHSEGADPKLPSEPIHSIRSFTDAIAAINILKTALEFYANDLRYQGSNQKPLPNDPHQPKDWVYRKDVLRDGGQVARNGLRAARQHLPPEGL